MNERRRVVTRDVLSRLTLDTQPWLSCDECFDRMDEYVERLLHEPGYTDPAMATHLTACSACAEEADSLRARLDPGRGAGLCQVEETSMVCQPVAPSGTTSARAAVCV